MSIGMRKHVLVWAALAIGSLGFAGSAQAAKKPKDPASDKPVYETPFPEGISWTLIEMNGKAVSGDAPSLKLDENKRGSGFSGCNTFSAALYPVRGQRLAMGPVAMTRKACPPAQMLFERQYLGILHSGPSWSLAAQDLIVKGKAGSLRFKRGF